MQITTMTNALTSRAKKILSKNIQPEQTQMTAMPSQTYRLSALRICTIMLMALMLFPVVATVTAEPAAATDPPATGGETFKKCMGTDTDNSDMGKAIKCFLGTTGGQFIGLVCKVLAIFILFGTIMVQLYKAYKDGSGFGKSLPVIIGALVASVILFNLDLLGNLLSFFLKLIQAVIETLAGLI